MKHIVLISPDNISNKMAGPSIRYWNLANQLSKTFIVDLMTPNDPELTHQNFKVSRYSKKYIKKNANQIDAIIIQGLTLFKNPYLKYTGIPLVVDLYDPFVLEMLEERESESTYKVDLEILLEQVRCGDHFLCASEKQRDFWIGLFVASGKVNVKKIRRDRSLKETIGIVPFGLESSDPVVTYNPFEKYVNKKVILWGGGLWDWLDPITLLKAFKILNEKRDDLILFFMGTKHPNELVAEKKVVSEMKKLIDQINLDKEIVIFNEWVPYNERQSYYKNAAIAVTTYFDNLETRFSFRTRVLDFIWCDLPMVLTKGDTLSTMIEDNGCGLALNPQDELELVSALEKLLDDEEFYDQCKKNIRNIKNDFFWEKAVKDLITICENPQKEHYGFWDILNERFLEIKLKIQFSTVKIPILFKKNAFKKVISFIKGV